MVDWIVDVALAKLSWNSGENFTVTFTLASVQITLAVLSTLVWMFTVVVP